MSDAVIRKLLETRLNTVGGVFPTAFENLTYKPQDGTPWQAAHLLPAPTQNPTLGDGYKREHGIMQTMLCYPKNVGVQPIHARAEVLKAGFARGLSMTEGLVTVRILRSPYSGPAMNDGPWCKVPVSVPYEAEVFSA